MELQSPAGSVPSASSLKYQRSRKRFWQRYGAPYVQKTEATYAEQVRERQERQLQRRARELGYELKKIETAEQPASATT